MEMQISPPRTIRTPLGDYVTTRDVLDETGTFNTIIDIETVRVPVLTLADDNVGRSWDRH